MIDYSKMSDFEINSLIAEKLHPHFDLSKFSVVKDGGVYCYGDESSFNFNPCNSPSDAWQIIAENKISVLHDAGFADSGPEWMACSDFYMNDRGVVDYMKHSSGDNPLRSAMIVFLMMHGEKIG